MAFLPSIMFELELAPLVPKKTQGIPASEIPGEFMTLPPNENSPNQPIVPLGLRWRMKPELGIPRQPFALWRRQRNIFEETQVTYTATEAGSFHIGDGVYHVPGGPFYILFVTLDNNDPTHAITVQAVNMADEKILGQVIQLPANNARVMKFQHPFIGGFSAKGNFTIKSIAGVTMKSFCEKSNGWELIQVVGLPAKTGEMQGYDPGQQGREGQLQDPIDAAALRLKTAQHFYEPLPTALPSGMQVPAWEIPAAGEAIEELRKGNPPLLERVGAMFEAVDNGNVHAQSDFRVKETIPGIHQPEFPSQITDDATMDLPLLATFLINAITDSWFALSSGFGSTDFPGYLHPTERILEPLSYFYVTHDYMVTSTFRFRYEGEVFTDPMYDEEYCALSHKSLVPTLPASGLTGSVFSLNRPPQRDEPWSVEASLTWTKVNRFQIQGNAIAVAESGTTGVYLNTLRPAELPHQPALFVPMKPGETSDPELITKNRFIHSQTELPFIGSRINKYGVASMDAFGRWSDWRETQLPLSARQPESPRLIDLKFTADKSRIAGNTAPHELSLEILWDWQDRSPKIFQLAAVFHRRLYFPDGTKDNGHIPPVNYPTIFQTNNTVAAGPLLELTVPSDNPPGTAPDFDTVPVNADPKVTIELLPQQTNGSGQNVDGEMRRYRVKIKDVMMSFNPDEEWFFTVFVKAAEWRNPALFSDTVLPIAPGRPPKLTAYVPNPIPAPPPVFIPATILWAPLPDARGMSRFRLSFDHIPNATGGYAVYRAYEAKLRDLGGLSVRADTDLVGRATDLRDLVMPQGKCIDAFTRINETLVPKPATGTKVEYEVEIDGTIDGLLAFAVASVTREQETSALSTPWLFVAVPKRMVPGLPMLSLQQQNGTAKISCEFPKAPKPSVVEIFRSQREVMSREADLMGAAVHEVAEAGWNALQENGQPAADPAKLHHFQFAVEEAITPSWFPYYFRAIAVGRPDNINGFVPGRSPQSNLVKVERLPAALPELKEHKAVQSLGQTIVLSFKSDALAEMTPHGGFKAEIYQYDFTQNKFADDPLIALSLIQALPVVASPVKKQLYYSAADANGRRTYQVTLDVSGPKFLFKIRLMDPLTRTSEKMVSGEMNQVVAPNVSNLLLRRRGRDLFVSFDSTVPVTPPAFGHYVVEINFVSQSHLTRLLIRTNIDDIPAGTAAQLENSPVSAIFRIKSTLPVHAPKYGAIFKNFYPVIVFPPTRGAIRVRITAPDNTSAMAVVNI